MVELRATPSLAGYPLVPPHAYAIRAPVPELLDVFRRWYAYGVELDLHQQLMRSVAAGEEIGRDHPYWGYAGELFGDVEADVRSRVEDVRDMRENGVRVPVDVFCDDRFILYLHGYHRMNAAIAFGHETVPVRFVAVSRALADVAGVLLSRYEGDLKLSVYQPVDHPYFALLPVHNVGIDDKIAAVARAMRERCLQTFVDAGAHHGYVTRALIADGFEGEAVDCDPAMLALQPKLERIGLARIPYRLASAETGLGDGCDALVVLGLLHHYTGSANWFPRLDAHIVPWMRERAKVTFAEHQHREVYAHIGGQDVRAHVPLLSADDVQLFWAERGFLAEPLYENERTRRCVYLVERTP